MDVCLQYGSSSKEGKSEMVISAYAKSLHFNFKSTTSPSNGFRQGVVRCSDCLVCPAVMLGTHQMWKIVVCLDDCVGAPTASPISMIIFQNAVGNG